MYSNSATVPRSSYSYMDYIVNSYDYRYSSNIDGVLDRISRCDSDASNALWNFLIAVDSGLHVRAVDINGNKHRLGTNKLRALLGSMKGKMVDVSIDSLLTNLTRLAVVRGGFGLEIITNKEGDFDQIKVIDPKWIEWKKEGEKFVAYQGNKKVSSEFFFWGTVDPDIDNPNPISMLMSALSSIFFRIGVLQDLEKVIKRAGYSKLTAEILEEVMYRNAPASIKRDDDKLRNYLKDRRDEIQDYLTNLRPEDAVAHFDSVKIQYLKDGFNGNIDVKPLMDVLNQQISSGLKTLPSILGRGAATAGTENVLYVRGVKFIQKRILIALNNAFSFALEREGVRAVSDVYFNEIDLRSPNEIENHKIMKQKRLLELLVLGFKTPDEVCYELTGHEIPSSYHKDEWIDMYRNQHLGLSVGTTDDDWSDNGDYNSEAEEQEPGEDTIDTRTDDEKVDNIIKNTVLRRVK